MLKSELDKLRAFYQTASPTAQSIVRGFICGVYYDEREDFFVKLGYPTYDKLIGGVKESEPLPDAVWEILEADSELETIEELAAAAIYSLYDSARENILAEASTVEGALLVATLAYDLKVKRESERKNFLESLPEEERETARRRFDEKYPLPKKLPLDTEIESIILNDLAHVPILDKTRLLKAYEARRGFYVSELMHPEYFGEGLKK